MTDDSEDPTYIQSCVETLLEVMRDRAAPPKTRVQAASTLLAYALGPPDEYSDSSPLESGSSVH